MRPEKGASGAAAEATLAPDAADVTECLRTRAITRRRHVAEILLYEREGLEQALRRFKRQVLREGILREAKRRTFYLKPSESKKLKSKLARARNNRQRRYNAVDQAAPNGSWRR